MQDCTALHCTALVVPIFTSRLAARIESSGSSRLFYAFQITRAGYSTAISDCSILGKSLKLLFSYASKGQKESQHYKKGNFVSSNAGVPGGETLDIASRNPEFLFLLVGKTHS